MDIRCYRLADLDTAAWDALTSHATIFHSRYWANVCEHGLRSLAQAMFYIGYLDGTPVAGCPLVTTRKMGLTSAYSMPFGTYGGIIESDSGSDGHKVELIKHLQREFSNSGYSMISIVNSPTAGDIPWGGYLRDEYSTHIIPLPGDDQYYPDDKKIEGHIRAGLKRGGEIIPIESESQVGDIIQLYHETERRHGRIRPIMPDNLFISLFQTFCDNPALYWTALLAENRIIGSMINLFYRDTMMNWQTVSDYEMREYKPNQLLLADAIAEAQRRGMLYINLGASPPDAEGLRDYKSRWGGREEKYAIYSKVSHLRKLIGR